jgi:hypothetical protein
VEGCATRHKTRVGIPRAMRARKMTVQVWVVVSFEKDAAI